MEPKIKVFYARNQKRDTSGYDKYVFDSVVDEFWALYINQRTKHKTRIRLKDGEPYSDYKDYFLSVVDYFISQENVYEETYKIFNKDKRPEAYKKELKLIMDKYPEYFI